MHRRAQFGVLVLAFVLCGRGLLATLSPIATVHLTEGWATFGQAVPQGLAFEGLRVGTLATQTDVKNRWPDGSIRFAIVTAKGLAEGDYEITSAPASGGGFSPAPQAASVALTINSCTPAPAPGQCPTGLYVASLPAPADTWLSGPLVHEGRSVVSPASGTGALHPYLRVNFDTRVYHDGTSRVDISVENMLNTASARTVGYDVVVTVPGTAPFARSTVEHHYLTRWRKVFSSAVFSTITPDLTPFNLSRALPPYLSIVADAISNHSSPDYDILGSGALDHNMPAHSGRQELAPYPDWTARYLVHKNPAQREFVLINGDLSGGWPVHLRETDGAGGDQPGLGQERLVSLDQRPDFWYDDRAAGRELAHILGAPLPIREYGDTEPAPGSGQSRLIPDNAHQPSIAYVPYLMTGDRYYAEEMAFWANYAMMRIDPGDPGQGGTRGSDGILENQETRGYAWALRNLADAAAYYPDASPVRSYLASKVAANLQWLDTYANAQDPVTNPLKILWLGYRGEQDAGFIALWEQNYLAYAIDRANKQGFIGGLDHRDAIARLQLALFTSEPAYPRVTLLATNTVVDGAILPAGTPLDWGAPYLLNVATVPDPSRPWENPTYFTSMSQVGAGTTGGAYYLDRWRPYPGYYGPEARLNLMIGVDGGWAGAQGAYDYLFPYIGINPAACGNISTGEDRPDLACRAGWALAFYPPYTPPVIGGGDGDGDGINDAADNCPAVANADQVDLDGDSIGNACDSDDDGDGISDGDESAAGSDPLNAASTPEVCDGADNNLDGLIDEGSPNLDGDAYADCVDTDDDGDGVSDADEFTRGSDPRNAASTPEICDGLDNDLDGSSDEGFPNNDGDTQGDCVDPDDDNDGTPDATDAFPLNPGETMDSDLDGIGNNADLDDDNDGRPDATDPLPLIANRVPTIVSPGPQSSTAGTTIVPLAIGALDLDGDALVYGATGLPLGLSLDSAGFIIGTPTTAAADTNEVTITVSDGLGGASATFNWTIQDDAVVGDPGDGGTVTTDNDPSPGATPADPVETAVTLPAGSSGSVSITETDVTLPTPAGFSLLNFQVNITAPPATANAPLVMVFRLDGSIIPAGQDENTLQLFRNGAAVPNCTATDGTATPDPCITLRRRITDVPLDDVELTVLTSAASTWNVGVAAPPADTDGDGTPDADDAFPEDPSETIDTDGDGVGNNADSDDDGDGIPDASDPNPLVSNRAPSVTPVDDRSDGEDAAVSFAISGIDPDGDTLTFSSSSLPPGVTLAANGAVGGAPTSPGTYTVNVVASDGYLSGSDTFTWVVVAAPAEPITLENPGPQSDMEGEWVSLRLEWDANLNTRKGRSRHYERPQVHFKATGLPPGLHIRKDGVISGRVANRAAGVRQATVTLRVGRQEVSQAFTWTINRKNRPPRLEHLDDQESKVGSAVKIVVRATDADGDPLTFTAKGLPPGLSMSTAGVISGTVGGGHREYHATVTVSDGKSQESCTFDWKATVVKEKKEKEKEKKK